MTRAYLCRKCGLPRKGHTCLAAKTPATTKLSGAQDLPASKNAHREETEEDSDREIHQEKKRPAHEESSRKGKKRKHLPKFPKAAQIHKRPTTEEQDSDWSSSEKDQGNDSSTSEEATKQQVTLKGRTAAPKNNPKTFTEETSSSWTAIMAPAHVLHDSLRDCFLSSSRQQQNSQDAVFLRQWNAAVQTRLQEQNQWMVENRALVAERRKKDQQVRHQRHELVKLSSKIRRVQGGNSKLQGSLQAVRHERNRDASQFLSVLEDRASLQRSQK